MLGCKAASGIAVSEISKEAQISRTYIYQQKVSVQNYIETLDKAAEPVLSKNIDKGFIKRMVLSLFLDCHASTEGIRVLHLSLKYICLHGRISSILEEASERAEQFDAGILLGQHHTRCK